MFDSMSGDDAKTALNFLFSAALDIEVETDHKQFIEKVLFHARKIFNASAGSIALIDGDHLQFMTLQNDEIDISQLIGSHHRIPLRKDSIAGYVALTGEMLHINDPYNLPEGVPYRFNSAVDKKTGFRTEAILAVPLRHPAEGVIGTLEILNPRDKIFHELNIGIAKGFSSIASANIVSKRLQGSLKRAYLETLVRLGLAAEYKDEDTFQHIQRIRHSSKIIARQLGFSEEEQDNIFHASAMHDVGKVSIPDGILNKKGKLDAEEWKIIQSHPEKGASILAGSDTKILQMSEEISRYHHEKWNGKGYPEGLKEEQIPLTARIVAVTDVFDALVQERPYKKAWPLQDALDLIQRERGEHFDPMVVDAFFACKNEIVNVQRVNGTIFE
ncbi:GAF domain-containing protein [Mariprofundus aestuarium]|uniref:GAF domain-containing protein n=1 Tax=Mariprofundus aestuarium TaxID=1921086 RepID=A0A2K8KWT4_MARES|nr:HD domain-containing phosphohydrolase [Mariprofundus aestuarium]ATX79338.1 GAF domain-containing protein [Mariprofundus aestuarium]